VLTTILEKPTVRAETVLDGIFSQAVIIVEADGDRTVYQAVLETLSDEFHLDVHFTAVGGTGGIADTCRLYRTLKIPVAVIADLDIIADLGRLEKVISELASGVETRQIKNAAARVSSAIKSLPPTVRPDEVVRDLDAVAGLSMDWSQNQDAPLREALQLLVRRLDRMRRIKSGGIDSLPAEVATQARTLVDELAKVGLFVVRVGELEEWLATNEVTAPKSNKWAWANEAASMIRKVGPQNGDVWDFVRSVAAFLNKTLNSATSD